ncbi:MAG: phosphatase PAP2 family protein [Chloroflexi bacterium]|nr:phosphatase PAP2 family protein [Chloroflexota bacterium]
MPSDLTIFAAQYLVYIDGALALGVLGWLLFRRPSPDVARWAVAVAIMIVLSYVIATIGAALYNDPRPFTQDHVKPLISHGPDNGFPSDHALLAAAIVAAVLLASPLWALVFAVPAILVDWARVGAGIHHLQDVIGSSVIVLLATIVALAVSPFIAGRLTRYLPAWWPGGVVSGRAPNRDTT